MTSKLPKVALGQTDRETGESKVLNFYSLDDARHWLERAVDHVQRAILDNA